MANDLTTANGLLQTEDSEYVRLVSLISERWEKARGTAALAINRELIDASWETGRYIVEFEQHGNVKADYGKQLLTNLSKDLTRLWGKGYSRSNLFNMRLFYVRFPKIQTVSGQLTWSHYLELLKCDDLLEMQFYMKECINEGWKVRELRRQINSSLFQRIALSTDKEGGAGSCKRGTSGAVSCGHHSRPVCSGVCRTFKAETLQGKGPGRCAEGPHGAIPAGTGTWFCLYWPAICRSHRQPPFQGGLGVLSCHLEMLCANRFEALRDKARRYRTDESLSELFQE